MFFNNNMEKKYEINILVDWVWNNFCLTYSITSAKRWVGGVKKWQVLLIYSTIYADVGGWVGIKKPKTYWRNTWMVPYGYLGMESSCKS